MKNRVVLGALTLVLAAAAACTSETVSSTPREASPSEPSPAAETSPPDDGAPASEPGKTGTSSGAPEAAPDAGREADAAKAPPGPAPFSKAEAQALFVKSCNACHEEWTGDFTKATVGVPSEQVPALALIHKGDKQKSYLFHKVAGTHASVGGSGVRMPKGKPALSATDIGRLGAFIDAL